MGDSYRLVNGDLVVLRISARNAQGWGPVSVLNTDGIRISDPIPDVPIVSLVGKTINQVDIAYENDSDLS